MEKEFKFTVPGQPMAWQRARQNYKTRAYFESGEQAAYKARVVHNARQADKDHVLPFHGPLVLRVAFYFKRPQAMCRKSDYLGWVVMDKRPDIDNLVKMIGDALNGVTWIDDGQICSVMMDKVYHGIGDAPRTEISIQKA